MTRTSRIKVKTYRLPSLESVGAEVAAAQLLEGVQLEFALALHGITPVTLTVFDWRGSRFPNARDAIAAASETDKLVTPTRIELVFSP